MDTETVRVSLLKELTEINKTIKNLEKEDPFKDPDHANDNAAIDTDAFEQSSHHRIEMLQKELQKRLILIQKTIVKIDKGTYGKCESCHKQIDPDRLRVAPATIFCITCEKNIG
jgi:RNA polymerase-binding transcription factor DksA